MQGLPGTGIGHSRRFLMGILGWVVCLCLPGSPRARTPPSSGGCFGIHIPVCPPEQQQRPEKRGEKGIFEAGAAWAGWGSRESGSSTTPGGFPGRAELRALPWPRGAAGALSQPRQRLLPGLAPGIPDPASPYLGLGAARGDAGVTPGTAGSQSRRWRWECSVGTGLDPAGKGMDEGPQAALIN